MAGISVRVNHAAFDRLAVGAKIKAVQKAVLLVQAEAKRLCASSEVAGTITADVSADGVGRVGTPEDLGLWLERGTGLFGPYKTLILPITQRGGPNPEARPRVLKLSSGGTVIFRPHVAGMHAKPFLKPALQVLNRRKIN